MMDGSPEPCVKMATTVINVKVAHIRTPEKPREYNLRDWMKEPNHVYIGRAGVVFIDGRRFPERASPFANPFRVGKDGTRDEVIAKYEGFIRQNSDLLKNIQGLRGKTLGCWCKPEACHGDVLVKIFNEFTLDESQYSPMV